MEIERLHTEIKEQHRQTHEKLDSISKDIVDVKLNVVNIEATMQTKDQCETHRDNVFTTIRKGDRLKAIIVAFGTIAAAIVGILVVLWKFR